MDIVGNAFLYLLLLVAVATGFLLGRLEKRGGRSRSEVVEDYFHGLNLMLNERPELRIDRFVQSMDLSDDSLDGHLAIAAVVRRRGEVDKAIRVHQHLLASPQLSQTHKHLVEFELARDFFAAGLLDRAEAILLQIVARQDEQLNPARALLLDLYEQEREWHNALEIGRGMLVEDPRLAERLSHHHCEIARRALGAGDPGSAREHAQAALRMAPDSPRGYGLAAEIEHVRGRPKRVARYIERCLRLKPDLVAGYLDLYRDTMHNLGRANAMREFLAALVARYPDPYAIEVLWADLCGGGGQPAVAEFVAHIQRAPSRQHIPLLLGWLESADPPERQRIKQILQTLATDVARFQCGSCGFRTQDYVWHCPTCKGWGTFSAYGRKH